MIQLIPTYSVAVQGLKMDDDRAVLRCPSTDIEALTRILSLSNADAWNVVLEPLLTSEPRLWAPDATDAAKEQQ